MAPLVRLFHHRMARARVIAHLEGSFSHTRQDMLPTKGFELLYHRGEGVHLIGSSFKPIEKVQKVSDSFLCHLDLLLELLIRRFVHGKLLSNTFQFVIMFYALTGVERGADFLLQDSVKAGGRCR